MKGSKIHVIWRGLFCYSLLVLFSMMLSVDTVSAQSAGDYRSATSGNWNDTGTWESYDGASWIAAASTPDKADGVITIRNGHTVTNTVAVTIDQTVVEAGGQITLNTGVLIVFNGAGIDLSVSGTVDNDQTLQFNANSETAFNDGATFINRAPTTFAANASLVFNDGSTYEHAQNDGIVLNASQTTWNAGSTCLVTGTTTTAPMGLGHTFHHFTWNAPGQTMDINLNGQIVAVNGDFTVISTGSGLLSWSMGLDDMLSIGGRFVQSGGIFAVNNGPGSAVLDLAGDFSMSAGELRMTTSSGSPTLKVAGDVLQSGGTITETGTGDAAIVLDGTSNQALTLDGTTSNDVDFEVDNSSGITLGCDFTPPRTLTLTSGNLTTSSNELILAGSASLDAGSNYISGALKQTFTTTGSKVFDVGTAGGYAPVTVNVTAGSGEVTVEATDGVHPNTLSSNVLERYWAITGPTITGADLTFEYLEADIPGGADEADFEIGKYSGGSWTFPGGSVNTATNTATITGLTSFSDWTLGDPGLLPVELVAFEAVVDGMDALLRWETASETNNAGFEIQRLPHYGDALPVWEAMAFVDGYGTTEFAQAYAYRVEDLAPGRHVFRLKQVDFDGAFEYHTEVEVVVEMAERFVVEPVYPNPFNPQAQFSFVVQRAQQVRVDLFDLLGRRVKGLYAGEVPSGQMQQVRIYGSGLPSGLYVVRVIGERFVETQTVTLLK